MIHWSYGYLFLHCERLFAYDVAIAENTSEVLPQISPNHVGVILLIKEIFYAANINAAYQCSRHINLVTVMKAVLLKLI